MKRIVSVLAVGVLILGGAVVAWAQTQEDPAPAPMARIEGPRLAILEDVLDGLVADGVITRDQADAVVEALVAKVSELKAEREALRQQIESFWEDGVLTSDELAQLPEDHPLRRAVESLSDGDITKEELRGLLGSRRGWRHFGGRLDGAGRDA